MSTIPKVQGPTTPKITFVPQKKTTSTGWNNKEIAIFSVGTGLALGISGAALGTMICPGLGTLIGCIAGIAAGILFGAITTSRHNDSAWATPNNQQPRAIEKKEPHDMDRDFIVNRRTTKSKDSKD